MKPILLIARRELAAYLRTWTGYIIIAASLAVVGLLFNGWVLGGADKRSADCANRRASCRVTCGRADHSARACADSSTGHRPIGRGRSARR